MTNTHPPVADERIENVGTPPSAGEPTVTITAREHARLIGQMNAIRLSLAVVEFDINGTILDANDNFLNALGYRHDEVVGRHHRLFVDNALVQSAEYRQFWDKLDRGEYIAGEVRRRAKDGADVWLQASYNPILDKQGRPFKIVKYATDITLQKKHATDNAGQIAAISKSLAVIEFELDGTIRTANDNFLALLGYRHEDVIGHHHRMFVEPDYARSADYREFWTKLNRGEYISGEVKRIGKHGQEVWLQASYNPIFDPRGRPYKIVKYAYDTTVATQAKLRQQRRVDEMLVVVAAVASGDLTQKLDTTGGDGMANIARGIERLVDDLRAHITAIAKHAQTVATASEELTAVSKQMSANASQTYAQAATVARSIDQVRDNVSTVAMGTEEFNASIREIASNANQASRVANRAVQLTEETNQGMRTLDDSSREIGQVTRTITSIAQQTKMLALNATIEAARAGDAGRGFAVVANEVKELAKETATATEDISRRIEAIQRNTGHAVTAIAEITTTIDEINNIQNTIASSVEEQTATAAEIGRNAADAATSTNAIASNVSQVAAAAQNTTTAAESSQESAISLAEIAAALQKLVQKFSY